MPLTITDFVEQVEGLTVEDISEENRERINDALTEVSDGPGGEAPPANDDAVLVSKNLDGRAGFTSIQDAIDGSNPQNGASGASEGDTIFVEPATYEERVTVSVSGVTLRSTQGPGETTVNAGPTHGPTEDTSDPADRNTGAALTVAAADVTVDGFEITNPDGLIGVKISSGADETAVLNNEIRDLGPTERLGVAGIATDPDSFSGIQIVGNTIENLRQELGEASQFRPTVNGILFDAGESSDTLTDTVVRNNTISGLRSDYAPLGIVLQQQLTNVAVEGNELSDIVANHAVDSNPDDDAQGEFTTFAQAINVAAGSTTNVTITGNVVAESVRSRDGFYGEAIKIDGSDVSGLSINGNDLLSPFALTNAASGTVDATNNYFNSPDGPNTETSQSSDPADDERPSTASVVLGPADTDPFRTSSITTGGGGT
jgi:hypothetical protein